MTQLTLKDVDLIAKLIKKHDKSCTCCGPTDYDRTAKAIARYFKYKGKKK